MARVSPWISLAAAAVLLAGCGGQAATRAPAFAQGGARVKVVTSFEPMREFALAVGGDKVDVINMVPAGTEPHDWEPTPGHIKVMNQATLFIYSGAGMEHWVPKTLDSLDNKGLTVVEASQGIDLIKGDDPEAESQWDPHVWLDPMDAIHEVENVRDGLIRVDGADAAFFTANAAAYIEKLKALDAEYRSGLSGCARQEFYTTHAAFGYLARRYGIEQRPIMGLTPDAEPKPRDLAAMIDEARTNQIRYIFFETLVSDRIAKMVAGEVGARTLVLNPLEGLTDQDLKAGKDYLSVMRENLVNLQTALECGK